MKKIISMLSAIYLLCHAAIVFADMCPPGFSLKTTKYVPPSGWHLTQQRLTTLTSYHLPDGSLKVIPFLFYVAVYDFDHEKGANNNRVSCIYKDRRDNLQIEITTDQQNIPKPGPPQWEPLDKDASVCAPAAALEIKDCPWG